MFVIPYFTKPFLSSTIDWAFLPTYIFLDNKGKQPWTCDESVEEILQTILPDNGFVYTKYEKHGNFLFVEIDSTKTNLQNFYSFEEVTKQKTKGTEECWRRFFLFVCKNPSEKHLETYWLSSMEPDFQTIFAHIQKKCML